jgi:hypothetical protein
MLVVRVFPARRVAEVIGLVVGVGSFLCSQSGQFANWVDVSRQQAVDSLQLVTRVNSPWSPLAWAGKGAGCRGVFWSCSPWRWLGGSLRSR